MIQATALRKCSSLALLARETCPPAPLPAPPRPLITIPRSLERPPAPARIPPDPLVCIVKLKLPMSRFWGLALAKMGQIWLKRALNYLFERGILCNIPSKRVQKQVHLSKQIFLFHISERQRYGNPFGSPPPYPEPIHAP